MEKKLSPAKITISGLQTSLYASVSIQLCAIEKRNVAKDLKLKKRKHGMCTAVPMITFTLTCHHGDSGVYCGLRQEMTADAMTMNI